MKTIIIFIIILLGSKFMYSQNTVFVPDHDIILPQYNGDWKLMWQDEFEDPNLPEWNKQNAVVRGFPNPGFWLNPDYVEVNNGVCSLKADDVYCTHTHWDPTAPDTNYPYTTHSFSYQVAEITSKRFFGYGKIEAFIKVPREIGVKTGFWTYGELYNYNEIDVFEFNGRGDSWSLIRSNIHYPNVNNIEQEHHCINGYYIPQGSTDDSYCTSGSIDFSDDYHKWVLIYQPDYIEWWVDDICFRKIWKYYTSDGTPIQAGSTLLANHTYFINTTFTEGPMQIILGLGIGTSPSSDPDNSTHFPAYIKIKSITYSQRENCNDISITSNDPFLTYNAFAANQFDPSYNLIIGQNINVSCNVILKTDHGNHDDYILAAKNSVKLNSGFHVKAIENSKFHSYIDQSICNSTLRSGNPSVITENINRDTVINIDSYRNNSQVSQNDNNNTQKNLEPIQINGNIKIKVFPNPNSGTFEIIIQNANPKDYSISILNNLSIALVVNQNLLESSSSFDLQKHSKGIYYLFITDNKTKKIYSNKIVYQ